MATITLRDTKGSPLSFAEMDSNLTNLNNDKLEIINNLAQTCALGDLCYGPGVTKGFPAVPGGHSAATSAARDLSAMTWCKHAEPKPDK